MSEHKIGGTYESNGEIYKIVGREQCPGCGECDLLNTPSCLNAPCMSHKCYYKKINKPNRKIRKEVRERSKELKTIN